MPIDPETQQSLAELFYKFGRNLGYGTLQEFTDAVNAKGVQGALDARPTYGQAPGADQLQGFGTTSNTDVGPGWGRYAQAFITRLMEGGMPRDRATAIAWRTYSQDKALWDEGKDHTNGGGNSSTEKMMQAYGLERPGIFGDVTNISQDEFDARKNRIKTWGEEWDGTPQGQASAAAASGGGTAGSTDVINDDLYKWVQSMSGQVDPNDPVVRGLEATGTNAAQRDARNRGVYGGLSGLNVQAGAQQAVQPYLQQRPQLALQGLSALSQRDLGLRNISLQELQAKNAAIAQQNAAAAGDFGQQQNSAASIGSVLGGAVGAVGALYTGNPGLIGAGASLGGGLGAMSAGSGPTMQGFKSRPGYTGYTRSGGSGGSNGGTGS